MSNKNIPAERVSTSYLLSLTSFFAGALVLIKAFEVAIAQAFSTASMGKAGVCLALFTVCCIWINKRNYFQDIAQRRHLMDLHLSFTQILWVIAALLFWSLLRLVLFGTK